MMPMTGKWLCTTINRIDPSLIVVPTENGVEAITYLARAKVAADLPCLVIPDSILPRDKWQKNLSGKLEKPATE